jgi:nicotinamide mononucleotide transporter
LYCWKIKIDKRDKVDKGFRFIDIKITVILLIVFVVLIVLLTVLLNQFSGSKAIIPDALIASLSIIATWMAAKKIVECWYIWIFVNIFATGLYIHQILYPTAVLFTVYSILSFVGLREWRKSVSINDSAHTRL